MWLSLGSNSVRVLRFGLGVDLGYLVPQVLLGLYRSWIRYFRTRAYPDVRLTLSSPLPLRLSLTSRFTHLLVTSPNPRYHAIITVIVTIPLIQIIAMLMAIFALAFEYPAPFLKGTVFERNFTFKAVYLVFQATFAILFYQVSLSERSSDLRWRLIDDIFM